MRIFLIVRKSTSHQRQTCVIKKYKGCFFVLKESKKVSFFFLILRLFVNLAGFHALHGFIGWLMRLTCAREVRKCVFDFLKAFDHIDGKSKSARQFLSLSSSVRNVSWFTILWKNPDALILSPLILCRLNLAWIRFALQKKFKTGIKSKCWRTTDWYFSVFKENLRGWSGAPGGGSHELKCLF